MGTPFPHLLCCQLGTCHSPTPGREPPEGRTCCRVPGERPAPNLAGAFLRASEAPVFQGSTFSRWGLLCSEGFCSSNSCLGYSTWETPKDAPVSHSGVCLSPHPLSLTFPGGSPPQSRCFWCRSPAVGAERPVNCGISTPLRCKVRLFFVGGQGSRKEDLVKSTFFPSLKHASNSSHEF